MPRSTTQRLRTEALRSPGPLWSAWAVVLATLGCAPAGPQADAGLAQALRRDLPQAAAGGSLSYLAGGDPQGRTVILVHGTPGSAEGWLDYVSQPPAGAHVVALDRPGFGHSGPGHAVPGLQAQAEAVQALVRQSAQPVVLLGHSLGGPIVAAVAALEPQRVAAVVLLAASMDPALETVHPMQRVGQWPLVRAVLPKTLRHANEELLALRDELLAQQALLGRVRAPVLIVHGTEDDLVPVANVLYMQTHLTGSRCVQTRLLEGHNHFLPWNAQAQVREALAWGLSPPC